MTYDPKTFIDKLVERGVKIERSDHVSGVLTLTKHFTPGDKSAYAKAEFDVGIIYEVPAKGGSTWGTDGASIGGYVGLKNGYMTLNRSGCKKTWLKALNRLIVSAFATPPAAKEHPVQGLSLDSANWARDNVKNGAEP